jgi:hypothetical protein
MYIKQTFLKNKFWKEIYYIEDKIIDIIKNIYHGTITNRYEFYNLITINLEFKIHTKYYVCIISKREHNYGFSLYNVEDPFKFSDIALNKTVENDKLYLYNIYKMIFIVLQNN